MHELIEQYFNPATSPPDVEDRLAIVFAWLEQAEKEGSRLAAENDRLQSRHSELNRVAKDKSLNFSGSEETVIIGDHVVFKRSAAGEQPEAHNADPLYATPESSSEAELVSALIWLKEIQEDNAALATENWRLLQKNLELNLVITGVTPNQSKPESLEPIVIGDHIAFGLSQAEIQSEPFIGQDGQLAVNWRLSGFLQTIPIPKSLADIKAWIDRYLANKVELLPPVERMAKAALYENVTLVYQALLLLGTRRDMLVHGGLNERRYFEEKLHELGLRHGASAGEANSAKIRDEYTVTWKGMSRQMDQALKRGVSRDSRKILRIYFFFDKESQKIIVGHLPTHLKNSMT